jgi:hypothetical protein
MGFKMRLSLHRQSSMLNASELQQEVFLLARNIKH